MSNTTQIALVGALVGMAFSFPSAIHSPTTAMTMGGLIGGAMIGAILMTIAGKLLIRPKK